MNSVERRTSKVAGLLILLVVILPEYARWMIQNEIHASWMVYGTEMRPYSYRALIPFLGRLFVILGLSPMQAMTVAVIAFAIGLIYGLIYFSKSFQE